MRLLMAITLLPGLFIIYLVNRQDKVEKEPAKLLIFLFILGALTCLPAAFVESVMDEILLESMYETDLSYLIIENFLIVALAEEFFKYVVLKLVTWKNSNFNYRYDAIVYAVCVGMGFAILENVLYVLDGGIEVALIRAVTSLPGHATFAIAMGIFYGNSKMFYGLAMKGKSKLYRFFALWVPVLLHGFYDYALSTEEWYMGIAFVIFIIVLDICCIKKIKKYSKEDLPV